jgi:hypothetical protein
MKLARKLLMEEMRSKYKILVGKPEGKIYAWMER